MRSLVGISLSLILFVCSCKSILSPKNKREWTNLFNGNDIKDWVVKINGHETGDNYGNTFRVEDGMIKVNEVI